MIYHTLLASLLPLAFSQSATNILCSFHDYEGDSKTYGDAYDNAPGWCGIRYSMLNVARITAVHNINADGCNQCLEVGATKGGPKVYILAVDKKGIEGLDVAQSSYQALFPNDNPLDPQRCDYKVVEPEKCGKICYGTAEECGIGRRNLLPASLLQPMPKAPIGLDKSAIANNIDSMHHQLDNTLDQSSPHSVVSPDITRTTSTETTDYNVLETYISAAIGKKSYLLELFIVMNLI